MDKERGTEHIQVNGIRLRVQMSGPENGRLVFLLHGFPEYSYGWQHQVEALAKKGYRVIVPDQRGYGLSSKPEKEKAYCLDELSKDIIGLIRFFKREKAVIVGHDWGGIVGWYMASVFPQYVAKLIILNVPHPAAFVKVAPLYPPQWLRTAYILFFQLPGLPEKLLERKNFRALKKIMTSTSRPGTFSISTLDKYEQAWKASGGVSGMLNWYRAMRRKVFWTVPNPHPQVPIRIIWGENDAALSLKLAKESLKKCQDGQLVLLGEATHWLHHEYPDLVNDWILRFLQEKCQKLPL